MQVKGIKGSILQYIRPSLSYQLFLSALFSLFLSGRLRQVLLCTINCLYLHDSDVSKYDSHELPVCLSVSCIVVKCLIYKCVHFSLSNTIFKKKMFLTIKYIFGIK